MIILALGAVAGALVNLLADVLPFGRAGHRRLLHARHGRAQVADAALGTRWRPVRVVGVYALAIAAAVAVYQKPPASLDATLLYTASMYLVLVTVIDIEHRLILHPLSLAGSVLMFAMGADFHGILPSLWGGVGGFAIMLLYYRFGHILRFGAANPAPKTPPVGFGDVILSGVLGLLAGWPDVLALLLIGVGLAGFFNLLVLVLHRLQGKDLAAATFPYAPFFAIGALIVLLYQVY